MSGEPSKESCRDAKGIIVAVGLGESVGDGEACEAEAREEKEFRTALEFRDRGETTELLLLLKRWSGLVRATGVEAICDCKAWSVSEVAVVVEAP